MCVAIHEVLYFFPPNPVSKQHDKSYWVKLTCQLSKLPCLFWRDNKNRRPFGFFYDDLLKGTRVTPTLFLHVINFAFSQVAMFIRDEGKGTLLTDVPEFCTSEPTSKQECVTSLKSGGPDCVSLYWIFSLRREGLKKKIVKAERGGRVREEGGVELLSVSQKKLKNRLSTDNTNILSLPVDSWR